MEAVALEVAELALLAEDTGYAGASRRLTAAERRAGVKFGALDALHRRSVARAEAALSPVFRASVDAVLAALGEGDLVEARALTVAVERLAREQPAAVTKAAEAAAAELRAMYADAYTAARDMAAAEVEHQGASAARVDAARAPERAPGAGVMATIAAGVALTPWRRLLGVVQERHTGPAAVLAGPVPRADLAAELEAVPMAGAVDEARQGVHQVVGAGRQDAAAAAGPSRIWSSELLDGSTCSACSAVDGREYESLEEAREDYPLGGFKDCRGQARCRGTLVYEYRPGRDGALPDPPRSILDELDV